MAGRNETMMKSFCNLRCRAFACELLGWVCLERQLLAAGAAAAAMVEYQKASANKPGV